MLSITSKDNRHFKSAVRVRNGKEKDLIFVEGRRLASEAIRSRLKIREAFFSREFASAESSLGLVGAIEERADDAFELPDKLFSGLADTKSPQGVLLVCERPSASLEKIGSRLADSDRGIPVVVVLHKISNPGNLGAVLRTAEAAGAAGVITTQGSVDAFTPAVLRGSMGAAFRLPVVEKLSTDDVFAWARESAATIIGTAADAGSDYSSQDWGRSTVVIFGSEAHGMQDSDSERADLNVRIPLEDGVESLNLAVSAGVILFEAKRQKDASGKGQ
jgi:TrmH family RNA methyltransferase